MAKADGIPAFPLQWPVGWPRTHGANRTNKTAFKCSPASAVIHLVQELERFGASDIVISTNARVVARSKLPTSEAMRRGWC